MLGEPPAGLRRARGGLHPARRRDDPPSAMVFTTSVFQGSAAGLGGRRHRRPPMLGRELFPAFPLLQERAAGPATPRQRSDDKLGDFVVGEIQGEVFAGSFDGEGLLDVDALLGQAAVAVEPFLLQPMGTAEGVALGRILAEVGQL